MVSSCTDLTDQQGAQWSQVCACVFAYLQIENASQVLIFPLERFRKEQISAAKVRLTSQ